MTTDSDIDDIARARPPEMSGPAALRRLAEQLDPMADSVSDHMRELAAQWEAHRAALEQALALLAEIEREERWKIIAPDTNAAQMVVSAAVADMCLRIADVLKAGRP